VYCIFSVTVSFVVDRAGTRLSAVLKCKQDKQSNSGEMWIAVNVFNKRSFVSEENCFLYTERFQYVATSEGNPLSYNCQQDNEYGQIVIWTVRQF